MRIADVFDEYYNRHTPEERAAGSWLLGFDVYDTIRDLAQADRFWHPIDDVLLLGRPVAFTLTPGVMRYRP